jgi:hypothetical protein
VSLQMPEERQQRVTSGCTFDLRLCRQPDQERTHHLGRPLGAKPVQTARGYGHANAANPLNSGVNLVAGEDSNLWPSGHEPDVPAIDRRAGRHGFEPERAQAARGNQRRPNRRSRSDLERVRKVGRP